MDGAGQLSLARSRLAGQQHGGIARRDPFHDGLERLAFRRSQPVKPVAGTGPQARVFPLEVYQHLYLADEVFQLFGGEWFRQIIVGPGFDGGHGVFV